MVCIAASTTIGHVIKATSQDILLLQPRVWRELLLAAIGEQFTSCVTPGDDVCGLSVSPRERDDLVQIWNLDAEAATRAGDNSPVLRKVHQLMPEVRFMAEFYKRK